MIKITSDAKPSLGIVKSAKNAIKSLSAYVYLTSVFQIGSYKTSDQCFSNFKQYFRGTSTARPKSRPSIISDDEYSTQKEDVSSRTELTSPDNPQSVDSSKNQNETQQNYMLQPSRPSFHVFGRK